MNRSNTLRFAFVAFVVLLATGLAVTACRPARPGSTVKAFTGNSLNEAPASPGPMLMIFESADSVNICRADRMIQARIETYLSERTVTPVSQSGASTSRFSDKVWRELRETRIEDFPQCTTEWEKWFMTTLSSGVPAPLDVAGLEMSQRTFSNIQAGLAAGSIAARCMGDGVGSTAMSVAAVLMNIASANGLICVR